MATRTRRRLPANVERLVDPRPREGEKPKTLGYRARVKIDGQTKRGRLRKTPKRAAADVQELEDLRDRFAAGDDPDPTLAQAIKKVLAVLALKRRRDATKEWFEHQFEVLKKEWPEDTKLRSITRARVQTWIAKRLETDEVSANTVHHHLRALRRLFNVCGLASPTKDPRLHVPDPVDPTPNVAPWHVVEQTIADLEKKAGEAGLAAKAAKKAGDYEAEERAERKERALYLDLGVLALAGYGGIRRREIARLTMRCIDWEDWFVRVEDAKVARQPRVLPVPDGLYTLLSWAFADCDREHLVPGKTEENRLEFLERLSRRRKVRLHSWRHAFGSELVRRGVPVHVVARLMGHKVAGTTMRYVHQHEPELRKAMERLWPEKK